MWENLKICNLLTDIVLIISELLICKYNLVHVTVIFNLVHVTVIFHVILGSTLK